mgnify:CR=1 FL=1|tara:strand:- start:4086 stop:5282 length:1197 start_codon:yes stop_codon:yes gene_type:complete
MSNGIWFGGETLEGTARNEIAKLAEKIEDARENMRKQAKKRGRWGILGKLAKTFLPGFGHVADFLLDRVIQNNIDLFDKKHEQAIKDAKGAYTGGEGGKMIDALLEAEDESNVGTGEALLSQAVDYAGSWAGKEVLQNPDFLKNIKKNLPDFMTFGMPEGDLPKVEVITKSAKAPDLAFDASNVSSEPRLPRKSLDDHIFDVSYDVEPPEISEVQEAFEADLTGGVDPNSISKEIGQSYGKFPEDILIDESPVTHEITPFGGKADPIWQRGKLERPPLPKEKNSFQGFKSEQDWEDWLHEEFYGDIGGQSSYLQEAFKKQLYDTDPKYDTLRDKYFGQDSWKEDYFGNIVKIQKDGGQVSKYYGGGSVEPTIVDYFSQKGKTLGGSDKESLAEKLGRR